VSVYGAINIVSVRRFKSASLQFCAQ